MGEHGTERLVGAIQDLSLAQTLETVMAIVRRAARELTGADGATFVLRDGEFCHYADEDAIAPLWKGQRFPLSACVSGWSMLHREAVAIEDIYVDPRIPTDAYRPTFVKSLAMVPIRVSRPIGAIGIYWADQHRPSDGELRLLQSLANSTSITMENVELCRDLNDRVQARTRELENANRELVREHAALLELQRQRDELAALVVHDIRSPATGIALTADGRLRRTDLSEPERKVWTNVLSASRVIARLAMNLLDLEASRAGAFVVRRGRIELAAVLEETHLVMAAVAGGRDQRLEIEPAPKGLTIEADAELLRRVLQNLIDNACRHAPVGTTVRVGSSVKDGELELTVSDEGPGIPPDMRETIFERFVSSPGAPHATPGRGLGLAFCRLAVEGHGGRIWVEDATPTGACFRLRIPLSGPASSELA